MPEVDTYVKTMEQDVIDPFVSARWALTVFVRWVPNFVMCRIRFFCRFALVTGRHTATLD